MKTEYLEDMETTVEMDYSENKVTEKAEVE